MAGRKSETPGKGRGGGGRGAGEQPASGAHGAPPPPTPLESWEQLQQQAPLVLDRLHAAPALMLAAAANPLLALEELGYQIAPAVRQEFSDRLRFGAGGALRLRRLRERVFEHAGHPFDLESATELQRVLFAELRLAPAPAVGPEKAAIGLADLGRLPVRTRYGPPGSTAAGAPTAAADPLAALELKHPIITPLLEYRSLEASQPRLASRELWDEIRQGRHAVPITSLVARLQSASA